MMSAVLSVAIINYETAELTSNCVAAIVENPPSEAYEILIVDNGSSESTLSILRTVVGPRLVETGVNGGFAAGVNRCMREADPAADVVIVLNSDTEVEAGALDGLVQSARLPGVGLAAPLLVDGDGRLQRTGHHRFPTLLTTWAAVCAPSAYVLLLMDAHLTHPTQYSAAEHRQGLRPAHVMGAVMAFRREAWFRIGEFDERFFMYLEETEWQARLQRSGWQIALTPESTVRHLHRGGDAAIAVPTLRYLDSARLYFGALGASDRTVRAVLASALLVSYFALVLYTPFARWVPGHREVVAASRPRARVAFWHALRGHRVPRPKPATAGPKSND